MTHVPLEDTSELWAAAVARMAELRDAAARDERISVRALDAWLMMARADGPMPAGVAIDFVQELSGDRREATQAILTAMTRMLLNRRPEVSEASSRRPELHYNAGVIAGHLGRWAFAHADYDLDHLRASLGTLLIDEELKDLHPLLCAWGDWCDAARSAYLLCCDLYTAAGPEGRK